ncbi:MAG TPA: vitamin K epoxide reductase family protein [Patescibacteria group bacterium]|nr:vitamin K epoxide reductase family protein [Patescibacteria group bacterium]
MSDKIYFWVKLLASIGISLALFLLWERYYQPSFKPCNINATINCDAVINGPVADTLGIPTPLIGLIGYIVIFFAAAFKKSKLVLGMAAFGLAFCLYIAFIELVILRVICPVCVLCQLDMITVFILGIILNKKQTASV